MQKTIHFVIQGKGGVGKSYSASLLFQYLKETYPKDKFLALDTDPNNSTLVSIKKIEAMFLDLFDQDERIDERKFDKMIELFFNRPDYHFIVDNGATSFLPLLSYIKENEIFPMISEQFNIIVHIPITGGQAQDDTMKAMEHLMESFKGTCSFVVWINEYFGKINDPDGKTFEDMDAYKFNKEFINGIVYLPEMNEKTYGKDLEQMTKNKKTFAEVLEDKKFSLMTKQRLSIYKKKIFASLGVINLMGEDKR